MRHQKIFGTFTRIPQQKIVNEDTRQHGTSDLHDLQIQQDLTQSEFVVAVQSSLSLMPALNQIIEEITFGIRDARGKEIIANYRPEWEEQALLKQWEIVRGWIGIFFENQFEVAPESFVIRLRSNQ